MNLLDPGNQIQLRNQIEPHLAYELIGNGVNHWQKHKLRQPHIIGTNLVHQFTHVGEGTVQNDAADVNAVFVVDVVLLC